MKRQRFSRFSPVLTIPFLIVGLVVIFVHCHRDPRPSPGINVVILLVDTLRADHSSLYGYERDTTPQLEKIAAEGMVMERFFVNSPWTKPSVATFLTGLHPTAHGSRIGQFEDLESEKGEDAKIEVLHPRLTTLPEILQSHGYYTAGITTNYHMTPRFGYHQGYRHYDFQPENAAWDRVCAADKKNIKQARKILRQKRRQPVFIWCHLMSVHGYQYPPGYHRFALPSVSTPIPEDALQRSRVEHYDSIEEAVLDYDRSIAFIDHQIGRFFSFIREKVPNTLLIVVSDHGEEFYEHGGFEHCHTLYNELLRVPCLLWGPGINSGRNSRLSSSVDLLPTILGFLDIPVPDLYPGRNFLRPDSGNPPPVPSVFAEQHHRGAFRRFALIRDSAKMVISESKNRDTQYLEFYYHHIEDEITNRYGSVPLETRRIFHTHLAAIREKNREYHQNRVGESTLKTMNPEDVEQLRSLGYIK